MPAFAGFLFRLLSSVFENQQARSALGEESSASEQSAEDFSLEETKFLKRKSVGTLNASAAREPGKFFIVKIKAGLVPALDLTKVFKVGREPQGKIN